MPRIFVISHKIKEPSYGRKKIGARVVIPWNTSYNHHRKFIKRLGEYLNGNKAVMKELYFWAEYEPQSTCTIINSVSPKAIHDCLCPVRKTTVPPNALNTDPYVFGNHFKNICCRIMKVHYQPGDVLLFGEIKKSNNSYTMELDTVLVIKEDVPIIPFLNTTQYYKASIEPLHRKKVFFYRGENYATNNKYYSFVPCLLEYPPTSSLVTLPAPLLDLTSVGFDVKRGWYGSVAKAIPFSDERWNKITDTVIKQGWQIGTYIEKI